MLKRKFKSSLEHTVSSKKKSNRIKLDILFDDNIRAPEDVQQAIDYIKSLVDWRKFSGKIPAVVLQSQLYSLLTDLSEVDRQLNKLRCEGNIVIIKLDVKCYGIVNKKAYLEAVNERVIEDDDFDSETAEQFVNFCSQDELDIEISSHHIYEQMKESKVSKLVRAGFLTSEVTGMFYLTIPNASLFLRELTSGLNYTKAIIKKSKFKEILMSDLLTKPVPKTNKLFMSYYILYLIGSETVRVTNTTMGPLLRYVDED